MVNGYDESTKVLRGALTATAVNVYCTVKRDSSKHTPFSLQRQFLREADRK